MDDPSVGDEDRSLFLLAVSEVTTNIVTHGGPGATLTLDVGIHAEDLRARIDDTAPPALIDWNSVSLPSEEAVSGRGLAIAVAVLDELSHEATETGNVWLLRRSLSGSAHDGLGV